MTCKRIVAACLVFCITAILGIALCGCEDLGAYSDTDEYYSSFGDIILFSGTERDEEEYSVKKYFYNKESKENFLAGEDGAYKGVPYSDYLYMAIPFESDITLDTLALYVQSQSVVAVYINAYVISPSEWEEIVNNDTNQEESSDTSNEESGDASTEESSDTSNEEPNDASTEVSEETSTEESTETSNETSNEESNDDSQKEENENVYVYPDPEKRIGDVTVHLKKGKWDSFVLDSFKVNGVTQKSIKIEKGQYILLQIRNNGGLRIFNEEKQTYVDPQTGIELPPAKITMTNLLIRALEIKNGNEAQEGE